MSNPEEIADRLFNTFKSKKNVEETFVDVIINNDLEHRLLIAKKYGEKYKNPLYEDIKAKLSGHFKELCGYCFLTPMEFNAKMLKRGFKGLSIDDEAIFEILVCHTLDEYKQIQDAYRTETKKELAKDLEKNFSGSLRKNVLNMISTERRKNENPDKGQCEKLANLLIDSGEKKWIDDENIFRDVFLLCSPQEMVLVGRYYFQKTGNNLIDVIEKKFSGKNKNLLREIVFANIIPHELYAEKIRNSIKGLGTNTALLNRVLAARTGVDMDEIKEIYQWKYGVTLKDDIIGDTSGSYQRLCLFVAEYE
jgi:hypothetical protein